MDFSRQPNDLVMRRLDESLYLNITFNSLTVIGNRKTVVIGKIKRTVVDCICICGKKIETTLHHVMKGHTKSCGCVCIGKRTHNKSKHPLYKIWDAMRYRCQNEKSISFERYGARGIGVCDEWNNSFEPFYDWAMANGWNIDLQIDRIDNNMGYSPENCRCVTPKENSRNRRDNVFVNVDGNNMILAAAIESKLICEKKFYQNKEYKQKYLVQND